MVVRFFVYNSDYRISCLKEGGFIVYKLRFDKGFLIDWVIR